jgi:hypothetical protein
MYASHTKQTEPGGANSGSHRRIRHSRWRSGKWSSLSLRRAQPTTSPPTRGRISATGARFRDPQQRLERALDELYAYYERTEPMLSNVLRDAELVDFARDSAAPLHAYLEEAAEILTTSRPVRGRRRHLLRGALRHALAFSTWHSLTANGLGRSDAAKLITAFVEAANGDRRNSPPSITELPQPVRLGLAE